jgi:hypothetical protein
MSDEPKKRRSWAWIGKTVIVLPFFCVNLLAAYVPALLFLRDRSYSVSPMEEFLRSPVAFAFLVVRESREPRSYHDAGYSVEQFLQAQRELQLIDWGLLVAFLLLLFVASAALYTSRMAWIAMPTIVLVCSLLQGLIAAFANGFGGG